MFLWEPDRQTDKTHKTTTGPIKSRANKLANACFLL